MQAIVCVSRNWGIGRNNDLLFHIHADLRRFRTLTLGKSVVMGYRTLLSFPNAKPLPSRRNIVLTHRALAIEGAEVVHSAEEAVRTAGEDGIVIGGGTVYAALLPCCDRVLVTQVDADADADTFFPDLDADPAWHAETVGEWQEEAGLRFRYVDYVRR